MEMCVLCGDKYEGELFEHRKGCWVEAKHATQENLDNPAREELKVGLAPEDGRIPAQIAQLPTW